VEVGFGKIRENQKEIRCLRKLMKCESSIVNSEFILFVNLN
jgi:hypothetical protein